MMKHVGLLAVVAAAGCLGASDDPEVAQVEQGLKSSFPAPRSRPQVGQVKFSVNGEKCTATLISHHALLTAAHCVPSPNKQRSAVSDGTWRTLGRDGFNHTYYISGWNALNQTCVYNWSACDKALDLALVYFYSDAGVPSSVAKPSQIRSTRPGDGTTVTVYGYGYSDSNCTTGADQKRRASFRVGTRPFFTCPGDSGGPGFTPDGKIFVVNSGWYAATGDVYGHPDENKAWIDAAIGAYASSGDLMPPTVSSIRAGFYPTHLDATVTDNDAVDFVDFYIDGSLAGFSESGPTYSISSGLPTSGVHTVTVIAYDYEGNPKQVDQSVDFTPPPCDSPVLFPGQSWYSPSGQYRMTFQGDGNVVLVSPDSVVRWQTNTLNYPGRMASHLKLECTGDLALYDTMGATWWHSNTGGIGPSSFAVQDDCNAVIYDANHNARWATNTFQCMPPPPSHPCGGLPSGAVLNTDESVYSCDGRFRLTMQLDGNLVLYQGSSRIWDNNAFGSGNSNYAVMQPDGNFCEYTGDHRWVWCSQSSYGYNGASLAVQTDGNMVIYATNSAAVWATNTCCR